MGAARRTHRLLSGQFAATISAQWRGWIIRLPRRGAIPLKDIIGRDLHKRNAKVSASAGHRAGGRAVDRGGAGFIFFCFIDRRIGGGVDHRIGAFLVDQGGADLRSF
ncbi:hypothetical protein A3747_20825 [Sulfitobacter sp. HI0076]|nr:hypothetical protein A3720_20645 [Sulfitobacter sp. HI0021]KZY03114.1 hypothetical protein A3722_21130 [Sulfitobacter sp. HI0027]KZZ00796.1 hypothetical protein A3747_20825 [Sulfitobacter sp. HI0076]